MLLSLGVSKGHLGMPIFAVTTKSVTGQPIITYHSGDTVQFGEDIMMIKPAAFDNVTNSFTSTVSGVYCIHLTLFSHSVIGSVRITSDVLPLKYVPDVAPQGSPLQVSVFDGDGPTTIPGKTLFVFLLIMFRSYR